MAAIPYEPPPWWQRTMPEPPDFIPPFSAMEEPLALLLSLVILLHLAVVAWRLRMRARRVDIDVANE
ncbi:MAG: hypothetical protein AAFP17_14875 [Pseudomonadota bacterium]